MTTLAKYHDRARNRPLRQPEDGCAFEDWAVRHGSCAYSTHPHGFLVFLPPDQLGASNEYAEGDPYDFKLASPFHRRRKDVTLRMIADIRAHLPERPHILDLGCGRGLITNAVRERFPESDVSGLDYSLTAIELAHRDFPDIEFVVADAYDPPYSAGYFDVVILNNIWEHVSDPLRLLSSISRILRAGGYVIISTPSRYRLGNLLRVLRGKPVQFMSSYHVTEYTVGQVIEQLRAGGYAVAGTYSTGMEAEHGGIVGTLRHKILLPIAGAVMRAIGSHHSFESTTFFLARKA